VFWKVDEVIIFELAAAAAVAVAVAVAAAAVVETFPEFILFHFRHEPHFYLLVWLTDS
jgi:hypothetical protein